MLTRPYLLIKTGFIHIVLHVESYTRFFFFEVEISATHRESLFGSFLLKF